MKTKLTPKEKMFIAEYLIDFNGTRAAIAAGYSKKSARTKAALLVAKVHIQEQLQKALKKRMQRVEITQDNVLKELSIVGFADMQDYVEVNPEGAVTLKPFDVMPEGASRAVSKVKETRRIMGSGTGEGKEMVLEIKTEYAHHDKIRALDLLGQHLGMWKLRHELTGADGAPLEVKIYLPDNRR